MSKGFVFYYKEKGVKRKKSWDDKMNYRRPQRFKQFNRIFKKFKGCHYNDALSYYLTIETSTKLIEQFKADIEAKKRYYNYKWPGWRINPEGIIELKLRDKKPRLLYTADYKTEKYYINKKTGKRKEKNDYFHITKDWEPATKIIKGKVLEFDSKREPLYKRKLSEKIKYLKKQKRNKVKNTIMPNDVYYAIAYNFFNNKRVDNELVNLFDYGINLTNKFNTNPEALIVFDQLKDLLPKRTSILILKLINNEKSG